MHVSAVGRARMSLARRSPKRVGPDRSLPAALKRYDFLQGRMSMIYIGDHYGRT